MYAIVELMGHRRFGARVTNAELAGAKVLRCEVLAFVEGRPPLLVQHVHPQALYAITECTEAQARAANQSTYAIQSPLAIEAPRPDDIPFDATPARSTASEPRDVSCTEHEIDMFENRGCARGLERIVVLDWVACSAEGLPHDEPVSAPTREELITKLVESHNGDREHVDSKLMNGDVFTRRRITVRAWAHDETAEPSLDWVSNRPECLCELATACPEHDEVRHG